MLRPEAAERGAGSSGDKEGVGGVELGKPKKVWRYRERVSLGHPPPLGPLSVPPYHLFPSPEGPKL